VTLKAAGKREAQIECARIITELESGTFQEPTKTTLAEFLERWLAHMKSQVSPRTHERYVEIARKNVAPYSAKKKFQSSTRFKSRRHTPRHWRPAAVTAKAVYRRAPFIICTAYWRKRLSRP